jgi:hypothetical protein
LLNRSRISLALNPGYMRIARYCCDQIALPSGPMV